MTKKRGVKKNVIIAFSSIAALGLVLLAVLFMVSGVFQKQEYLAPWQKTYSAQFEDPRLRLAAHGLLAANGHNMQPWKIKLDKNDPLVFYLYADSSRFTKEVDPLARQLMITQGTFLEYVAIAGNQLGYPAGIELFPYGNFNEESLIQSMQTTPVAKITLTKGEAQADPLYDAMFLPDTNRGPYQPAALTTEQINRLMSVNSDHNMTFMIFQDEKDRDKLGAFAMTGTLIESDVTRVMEESANIFRANEYEKNQFRYGFSLDGQGTTGIMQHIMQGMITLFPSLNSTKSAADLTIRNAQTAIDHTPAYAMIETSDNSRLSQVKSGMLYSRLVLAAHNEGIVMQPLSQVLEEYPEMRDPYEGIHREYAPDHGTVQMLLRLGHPEKEAALSMRRDVMDLIKAD